MALDTTIPLRAFDIPINFLSPREQEDNALARQMKLMQMQSAQADMQDRQTARAQQNALARAMQMARSPDGSIDYAKLSAAQGIDPMQAMKFSDEGRRVAADQATAQREAEKAKLAKAKSDIDMLGQLLGSVKDQSTYQSAYLRAKAAGIDLTGVPEAYDPNYVTQARQQALTAAQQLEQYWKQQGYDLDVRKQTETERNNLTQNRISQGNLGVAQANLGLSRQRLALEQSNPKGQYDPSRGVIVDTRTGQAVPVTMQGGAPLPQQKQSNLKPIPASVNKAIVENAQNLRKAQQALSLIGGAGDGDANATGLKGYAPNVLLNRFDPKGTKTRAAISDLGSMILHDRSGAAVTAAESPRLMPFIPLATDDPAAVKKKLQRFVEIYQQETNDMAEIYSPEQGYTPNPVLQRTQSVAPNAASTGKTPGTNSGGWSVKEVK